VNHLAPAPVRVVCAVAAVRSGQAGSRIGWANPSRAVDDRYYVKIVPHRGDTIHRFVVRKRDAAIALVAFVCVAFAVLAGALRVQRAHFDAQRARDEASMLARLSGQTQALRRELDRVQSENEEIAALIGVSSGANPKLFASASSSLPVSRLLAIEARARMISGASFKTIAQATELRTLALRVLNVRHIDALERAQMLAAIPSIDPVTGAQVVGCFCFRSYPDAEFHEGVDLDANYGDPVRAAAAGVVADAGWDGGYGLKIDIDHGNGYHTWYAHLSKIGVTVGEHVYKGETIAAVGATGYATGPHLHYQVMFDGRPIDPTPFLHGVPESVVASLH
jgi:murein DD-endopeptidase MepM/ murein hydrolase activator NlpD